MAAVKIKKSVGKNGKNDAGDAKKIQELLNLHKSKGGYAALAVDGDVGKKTIAAIIAFQSKVMGVKADGRVDVDGPTLAALNARPGTVSPPPDPSPASGGSSKKKPSSGGGPGGSSADMSGAEKRIEAAEQAIADTSAVISDHEAISSRLRLREVALEQFQAVVAERINVAKAALAVADEQRKIKALMELENAAAKAGMCLIETEQEAASIEGARCEAGLGAQIIACGKLFLNDSVSKIAAKLDAGKTKLDLLMMTARGVLKTVRIANEAYILLLKGKRSLHETTLETAKKELKALA